MINLNETIEGAEAILLKLWEKAGRNDAASPQTVASAYAEAYGYLKQGVSMYLEEQAREREERRFEEEIDD